VSEPRIATSAWWDPQTWAAAKDAYDAERLRGGGPRSFIEWIHQAIEQHARRGPTGRAGLQIPDRPVTSERDGLRRAHPLRAHTRELLEQARAEDRELGRELSVSGWIYQAVVVAILRASDGAIQTR
jgi:hypothetical protein